MSVASPEARAQWPDGPLAAPKTDRGIFPELLSQVTLWYPQWLKQAPAVVFSSKAGKFVAVAGMPVAPARGSEGLELALAGVSAMDADGDGIPNALDIVIGGKKAVLNGAHYKNTYRQLEYPGGDLPRDEGVCTDVIIRALRNAGFDLQQLVHEDIKRTPGRYPMVNKPDRSIDHRRVRTILPYFKHHWRSLPSDPKSSAEPYLPGDICFMDTMRGPEPEHLGIVSDRVGKSGLPLLINNWTDGYRTAEMDLLDWVPVTHRFRLPAGPLSAKREDRGLDGVIKRRGLRIEPEHEQAVLVTAPTWGSSSGNLRRYQRSDGAWLPVGQALEVRLGQRGLGRGLGLHGEALGRVEAKREGDRRSPSGIFALGTAFGPGIAPYRGSWPWREVDERDRFVDDPRSRFYNTWQRAPVSGKVQWESAESLDMYSLGLVVGHNVSPAQPGAGSAIFIHPWKDASTPTLGCTVLPQARLVELLAWLRPEAKPVLVQVAGFVY